MWPYLFILAATALIVLHLWWRGRMAGVEQRLAAQKTVVGQLESKLYSITAQHQAERAALFNSMIEGVLVLNPEGKIQLVNRALEEMLQVTSEVRGKTILEAFRNHELHELLARLGKEETIVVMELQLPGINRRFLQVNATALLDAEQQRKGSIVVFHDLTRIKELENTRQEFVANVSHELRTPLSLIKGFTETLINGARDKPEVALGFLQTIDKHADRLTYLIDDLLTISRLECGQIQLKLQPVSPAAVVARVFEDLASRAQDKKVSLVNLVPELAALADPERIQQVVFNLVDNAIKYGKVGGRVEVSGETDEKRYIQVSVHDDGPGIPDEAVQRVFERFYRVDKARTREEGGTGLGLSIVKHIIDCHGGKVWVKSPPEQGTTFYFTLPPTGTGFGG